MPQKSWIDNICEAARITQAAVFMKDSLIPIVGEENMRREFPWDKGGLQAAGAEAGAEASAAALMPGA